MNDDLYQVLGVDREASRAQIRRAYWKLARDAHPDAGGDPEAFVVITAAYNVLEDPESRKSYDLSGDMGEEYSLKAQTRVIEQIASVFEQTIEDLDRPPEEVDLIGEMRAKIRMLLGKFEAEDNKLAKILEGMHKMAKLVKKRGEGRNIFYEIAKKRISEISEDARLMKMQIRDARRALEELERYESIVDVIRTVQSGAYAAKGMGRFLGLTSG